MKHSGHIARNVSWKDLISLLPFVPPSLFLPFYLFSPFPSPSLFLLPPFS